MSVFELLSANLGKAVEGIMIPIFAEVAAKVASEFGEEPPSQDSMKVLFEDAFKKSLANPGKSKAKAAPKKKNSDKVKKEPVKKVKKGPTPKPQWLTNQEMHELLKEEKGEYYCGFVADRGPNKGKYCATVLTEVHKNCGELTEDGWNHHAPEDEFKAVGDIGVKMRCKKCWAKGKNGCYRKEGGYEKFYNKVEDKKPEVKVEDLPEVETAENDGTDDETQPPKSDELYEQTTDDENDEVEDDNDEKEEDNNDEQDTENPLDVLDGLI